MIFRKIYSLDVEMLKRGKVELVPIKLIPIPFNRRYMAWDTIFPQSLSKYHVVMHSAKSDVSEQGLPGKLIILLQFKLVID